MSFLYFFAINKLSIYTVKVNPLIMTLSLVKILRSEKSDIKPIDLKNFLSKKYHK